MLNDLLYVIVQEGVYRHDIGGVFDAEESATFAAVEMVQNEKDHYHEVLVLKYKLNQSVDDGDLVCTIRGERNSENIDITYPDDVDV